MISIAISIYLSFYAESLNTKLVVLNPYQAMLTSTMTSDVFRGDATTVSGYMCNHISYCRVELTIGFSLQDMTVAI